VNFRLSFTEVVMNPAFLKMWTHFLTGVEAYGAEKAEFG
jgi:hypothetical protein